MDGVAQLAETIAGKLSAERLELLVAGLSASVADAIRDAVLEGVAGADVHRTWLAEIDRIASNTEDIVDLRKAISAYLRQAGIERLEEISDETRFVVSQGGGSGACRVTQPAYIDKVTKRTILVGRATRELPVGEPPGDVSASRQSRRRGGRGSELRD